MSTQPTAADRAMASFEKEATRWGSLTMALGLLASLIGPIYLVFFSGVDVTFGQITAAFVAVAAVIGVFWVLEPITYFPILGAPAMYQAFMIGNISNKLLPAAIVAQSAIGVKPGTRRGDLAAVMAIGGAALVHLTSLVVFVGIFGTWLISALPASVTDVVRTFILPALIGAVLVQAIWTLKAPRATVIALVVAFIVQFTIVPAWSKGALYAVAICVFATVIISWLARDRSVTGAEADEVVEEAESLT